MTESIPDTSPIYLCYSRPTKKEMDFVRFSPFFFDFPTKTALFSTANHCENAYRQQILSSKSCVERQRQLKLTASDIVRNFFLVCTPKSMSKPGNLVLVQFFYFFRKP